jgi:hypothetical protein
MILKNKLVVVGFNVLLSMGAHSYLCAQSFDDLINEFSQDIDSLESELNAPQPEAAPKPISPQPEAHKDEAPSLETQIDDEFVTGRMQETGSITLQGLDKQTARVYIIDAPIGKVIEFGTLRVLVHRCLQSAPEDHPESKAFIVISENKVDAEPQVLFSGWMFASSPAISALDHPVYDVWVKNCKAQ